MKCYRLIALSILFFGMIEVTAQVASDSITFYLLRGIGRESGHWGTKVPDAISTQLPQARFVLMDLPGAGRYHDQPALQTIEKMADFLRAAYQPQHDSLSSKRVIVATSLAGNVALEWISTYPTDFQGAVLISSSLKGVCKSKDRVRPEAKQDFVDIFLMDDLMAREKAFLSINSNLNIDNDSLLNAWVTLQQQHPVSRSALLRQTVAGMVYKPAKDAPTAKVLVIGSEADKIVATPCLESVATTLKSDLYLHPTAGHGLPIDAPDWLADTVSHWVSTRVIPFQLPDPLQSQEISTRTSDNGLIPLPFVDKSTQAVGKASSNAWQATISGWQWIDGSVDWVGSFIKEVKVKDLTQRNQLEEIEKEAPQLSEGKTS